MNTLDNSFLSVLEAIEQKLHITVWFAGTNHPIEKPEEIKDIIVDGDMMLFWYYGENYSCPVKPRNWEMNFFVDESKAIYSIKMWEKPRVFDSYCIRRGVREAVLYI